MTTLAISKDLLARYSRLDHATRGRVEELAVKCGQLTMQDLRDSKGLNLESYTNQRDPRARTIRLGDKHRGIVMLPDRAETIVLVDVLVHEEADRWMLRNEFRVNEATGALELVDVAGLGEILANPPPPGDAATSDDATPLYAHRTDKDFTRLGIDSDLLPLLRVLQDEDQLQSLLMVLPQGQADALIMLTGDEPVEVLYTALVGATPPRDVDTGDLAAAISSPASSGQFHVVEDQSELAEMLAKPLAAWRTYLHPTQRDIAYRTTYNGPARVTGGAGTGKTVVAIHRAKALADALDDSVRGRPILFTTFTRNLAQSIEQDLVALGGTDLLDRVEVLNVDRLAHQVVADAEGAAPGIIDPDHLRKVWENALHEVGCDLPVTFVLQEWEQVVLAQGIESRDAYFTASRAGRGTRLDRRARAEVWKVVEAATAEMTRRRQRTFLQIADDAAGYLEGTTVRPYRHVVLDEAQDLHEAQWRLLRATVAPGANDLFIVGDSHQRIYDRRSTLSKVGIEVRGRSRLLRINYRTTHEILRWSLAVLGEGDFDDLDTGTEARNRAVFHSFLHGPPPTVAGFDTAADMTAGLAGQIAAWISDGVEPSEIGVAARTRAGFASVEAALRDAGVPSFRLGRDLRFGEGVALATMHRMKGLEYRCMAVMGVGAEQVPPPTALAAVVGDPSEHALLIRREQCLLYVACTRAREDLWVGYTGEPSPFLPT